MISLNEKSMGMIDLILREFKDQLDFDEYGNSEYFTNETTKGITNTETSPSRKVK